MKTHTQYPEGAVLLRALSRPLPRVSHGDGIYLFGEDGRRYIDASSGALVASVGHGNREVVDAIAAQLARVAYVNGTHFTSAPTEELAARLASMAPGEARRVAFLGSGSEAIEAAVKFARQVQVERGEAARTRVIARAPSYHGNTFYALSLSGRPHYKKMYGPMLSEVHTISAPYEYRCGFSGYEAQGAAHYAAELERVIEANGAETFAAFICEPVGGSSTGGAMPPAGYHARMQEVCARHGILTIYDEVMCGAGRCGSFFASSLFGADPDILVLGKGISGGYVPLSAVMVRTRDVDTLRAGSGGFAHAQTYLQAPSMTAAGLATLDYMRTHGLVERARDVGSYLHQELRRALLPIEGVGNIAGVGLLAGVEFVADASTRAPFSRVLGVAERVQAALFDAGVIVWPNVGHAARGEGDLVMVGPPLVITREQVDDLVARLAETLLPVLARALAAA